MAVSNYKLGLADIPRQTVNMDSITKPGGCHSVIMCFFLPGSINAFKIYFLNAIVSAIFLTKGQIWRQVIALKVHWE